MFLQSYNGNNNINEQPHNQVARVSLNTNWSGATALPNIYEYGLNLVVQLVNVNTSIMNPYSTLPSLPGHKSILIFEKRYYGNISKIS